MTLDCGHEPSEHSSLTTGYGTDNQGKTLCYACCAERDKDQMIKDGKTILYLTQSAVTNWPGSLSLPIRGRRTGRHNIAGKKFDVWFNGPDGHVWHGTQYGEMTQLCHCKRTSEKVAP